jgi:hypothetical protein
MTAAVIQRIRDAIGEEPHTVNVIIEISLPPDLVERMDTAIERLSRSVATREQFALNAIQWALDNLAATDELTTMGLDI